MGRDRSAACPDVTTPEPQDFLSHSKGSSISPLWVLYAKPSILQQKTARICIRAVIPFHPRAPLLHVIVEEKLIWMGTQAQSIMLFAFVGNPHIQKVLGKDIPFEQEIMVFFESDDGFFQAARNLRHFGHLFRRQFVEIFVHWFAGIDLVLN